MWDGIDRKSAPPLIFRTFQGTITNIINYSVTKYLPLTLIAIVNNMSPLICVVLAFFILKEKIKGFEIVMIVLTVAGVLTVVVFQNATEASDYPQTSKALEYGLYTALFINPLLTAGGSISMRKMKKFHEAVVSWYLNWGIGLSSLLLVLILGEGFEVIGNFDWVSWLLSFGTGLFALTSQTARFMALKL